MSLGAADLSPAFLNTGTTDEKFQQSEQQGSFRHILKSLASMHESSGSRFFRAILETFVLLLLSVSWSDKSIISATTLCVLFAAIFYLNMRRIYM